MERRELYGDIPTTAPTTTPEVAADIVTDEERGQFILDEIQRSISEVRLDAVATQEMIHITVSKEANDLILKYITRNTKDKYGLTLNSLFGCAYHVSPFLSNTDTSTDNDPIMAVVGLFNYAQMLGQWNTFTDDGRKYDIKDLLENKRIIK